MIHIEKKGDCYPQIVAGNRDYGKLMPSTIGISANKL